jgi:hypothetical protein
LPYIYIDTAYKYQYIYIYTFLLAVMWREVSILSVNRF